MLSNLLVVSLLVLYKFVDANISCKKDEYMVIRDGQKSCLPCNHCVHGEGLDPPCGSILDHPPQVECFPCKPGTYSDEHGPSSCKPCHICSLHEIITKNCSSESNTVCSGSCELGWYYDNTTHDCQPCSQCCEDADDVRIDQCQSLLKQCSVHSKCSLLSTRESNKKGRSFNASKKSDLFKGTTIAIIVGISLALFAYVICSCFVISWLAKRNPKYYSLC